MNINSVIGSRSFSRLFSRSRIAAIVAIVIIGTVAVGVVRASGDPVRQIRANDAAVWELDRSLGRLSHWNTALDAVGSAYRVERDGRLSVEQEQAGVVLVDRSDQLLRIFDDRDQQLVGSELQISGDAIVRVGATSVWVIEPEAGRVLRVPSSDLITTTSLDGFVVFSAGKPVVGELGADGSLHVLEPTSGMVTTWRADGSRATTDTVGPVSASSQISAIGATPVVLDSGASNLYVLGKGTRTLRLTRTGLLLAMPTQRTDNVVVVDRDGTISSIDLASGEFTDLIAQVGPLSIRPLVAANGCVIGASSTDGLVGSKCPAGSPLLKPNAFEAGHQLQGRLVRGAPIIDDLDSRRVVALRASGEYTALDTSAQDQQLADAAADQGEQRSTSAGDEEQDRPPRAVDDQLRVRPGRSSFLPVLANDLDSEGDDLSVLRISGLPTATRIASADIAVGGTGIVFRPLPGFSGAASFQYVVGDPDGQTDTANVEVVVDDIRNEAPITQSDESVGAVGRPSLIDVLANDRDPDGDEISVATVEVQSGGGTASIGVNGLVSFVATSTGNASVRYVVQDERGLTSVGVLTILVSGEQNLPPIARNDVFEVVIGRTSSLDLLANDLDPDGSQLTLVSTPSSLAPIGSLQKDGNRVRLNSTQVGSQTFTYEVSDGTTTVTGQARIVVSAAVSNRSPVAVPDRLVMTPGGEATINVVANDLDPDSDVIGVVSWTPPSGIDITSTDSRRLIVRMDAAITTPQIVVYELSDGTTPVPGTLLIAPIRQLDNLAPLATADRFGVRAGASRSIDVLANDSDPEAGALKIAQLDGAPSGVTVASNGRQLLIDGAASQQPFTFSYDVEDSAGNRAKARVEIEVVTDPNLNRAPVTRPDDVVIRSGDTVIIPVLANDDDPDGDALEFGDIGLPSKGTVQVLDGFLRYEANQDVTGTDKFIYEVIDRRGGTATAEVLVGVLPSPRSNRPPVAVDDGPIPVVAGETILVSVLTNDFDPDGDRVSVAFVDKPALGSAAVTPQGQVSFTAVAPGRVQVRYSITDSSGAGASATVTFDVSQARNAGQPPIARPDEATSPIVGTRVIVDVLANDDDPGGDPAALRVVQIEGGNAKIARNGRAIELTAGPLPVTARYTIADPQGNTATSTARLTVVNVAELMVRDDTSRVGPGKSVEIDVLSNDSVDPTRGPLRIVDVGTTPGGSTASVAGAKVRFSAKSDFTGVASFTYTVTDSAGNRKNGTVRVDVVPGPLANRPPVTRAGGPITLLGGATGVIDLVSLASDPDGQRLTFQISGVPPEVTAVLDGTIVRVTASLSAPTNWRGSVSFTATDPEGLSSNNQIAIRIAVPVATTQAGPPPTTARAITVPPTTAANPVVAAATTTVPTTLPPIRSAEVTTIAPVSSPGSTVSPTIVSPTTASPATSRSVAQISTTQPVASSTIGTLAVSEASTTSPVATLAVVVTSPQTNPPSTVNGSGVAITATPGSAATTPATSPSTAPTTTGPAATTPNGTTPVATGVGTTVSGGTTPSGTTPSGTTSATTATTAATATTGGSSATTSATIAATVATTSTTVRVVATGTAPLTLSTNPTIPVTDAITTTTRATTTTISPTTSPPAATSTTLAPTTTIATTTTATPTTATPTTAGPTTASTTTASTTTTSTTTTSTTTTSTTTTTTVAPALNASAPTVQITGTSTALESWTAVPGALTYDVQLDGGAAVSVGSATSYSWTGLAPGTLYRFAVRACDASRCGPWSPQTAATTQAAPTTVAPTTVATTTVATTIATTLPPTTVGSLLPGAPGSMLISTNPTFLQISWSSPADFGSGVTYYEFSANGTVLSNGLDYSYSYAPKPPQGTSILFAVRACGPAGCGPARVEGYTVRTQPPSGMNAPLVSPNGTSIAVSWSSPGSWGDEVGYYVVYQGGTEIYRGNGFSATFQGTSGSTYNFFASACNPGGCATSAGTVVNIP